MVDDADYATLSAYRWHTLKSGSDGLYAARQMTLGKGRQTAVLMHRQIMNAPKGMQVDHRDLNTMNNTRKNLRLATNQQNRCDTPVRKCNPTGLKGVTMRSDGNKFVAIIISKGVRKHLGSFPTKELAHAAYCEAAKVLHGEFARTN